MRKGVHTVDLHAKAFPTLPGEPGDGPLVAGSNPSAIASPGANLILKLVDRLEAAIPKTAPFWQVLHDALAAVRAVSIAAIPDTTGAQAALQKAAAQVQDVNAVLHS